MVEDTVVEFCNRHCVNDCTVLLAVSGGADSVALFHIFQRVRSRLSLRGIGVAHVHHGLRPTASDAEAAFVARLAEQAGCRFHITRLAGKSLHDTAVEEWARAARYGFFRELQATRGYNFVATGHTADDQAETVLMRIDRGSGIAGLCGIKEVREDGVIRPLLRLRREELVAWLRRNGTQWCEDATNRDLKYTRNYIRHRVLPALARRDPAVVDHLLAFAGYMQEQMRRAQPLVNAWTHAHLREEEPGRFVLRKPGAAEGAFTASEAIAQLFRKHGISFEKKHIDSFLARTGRSSGSFLLKGGWRYFPGRECITVVSPQHLRAGKPDVVSCALAVPGDTRCAGFGYLFTATVEKRDAAAPAYDRGNSTVYLDFDKTGQRLFVRAAEDREFFLPLGYAHPVRMTRFLKGRGISSFYRKNRSVLAGERGSVIWIPGVAIGHAYRITGATKTVVTISCRRMC